MKKSHFLALSSLIVANLTAPILAEAAGMPAAPTSGAATYVSGGVGEDEAHAMQQEAKNYPLELEFVVKAKPHDEYTANVHVKVSDAHGKTIIDTRTNGPFLLAKLPDGKYRIEATQHHQTKTREVTLKSGMHQRVVMEWAA